MSWTKNPQTGLPAFALKGRRLSDLNPHLVMKHKHLATVFGAAILAALSAASRQQAAAEPRWNIPFSFADDWGRQACC
jgi:hypothetical protein